MCDLYNRPRRSFVRFERANLAGDGHSRGVLVVVAPGQGAQKPGFLSPWLADSSAAQLLHSFSDVTQLDLEHFGTAADADAIRDTAIAQPLLVASALLSYRALMAAGAPEPQLLAGHSVGELAAMAISGVLSDTDALSLVRERGLAMAAASAQHPTSMTAVLGGDHQEVLAAIEAAGLTAANNNGPGQLVVAGTVAQLAEFASNPPHRARLVPLSVAGAFHTSHMIPAVTQLETAAANITVLEPRIALLTNADGSQVTSGAAALSHMVQQVAHPVRWDLCLETMASLGITGLLELTPAGTLTGIAKRNLKGVELFALNTPDQLDAALEFARNHAA